MMVNSLRFWFFLALFMIVHGDTVNERHLDASSKIGRADDTIGDFHDRLMSFPKSMLPHELFKSAFERNGDSPLL